MYENYSYKHGDEAHLHFLSHNAIFVDFRTVSMKITVVGTATLIFC